jgi:hypothetical protein
VLGDFQVVAPILWLAVGVVVMLVAGIAFRAGARHVAMIFCLLLLTSLFQWGHSFHMVHGAFSNYQSTLASLTATLSMTHHYYSLSTGNLDSLRGRDIISARAYNALVDTLQRNGYRAQYVHSRRYQVQRGAALDFYWPQAPVTAALEGFLGPWSRTLLAKVGRDGQGRFRLVAGTGGDRVARSLQKTRRRERALSRS